MKMIEFDLPEFAFIEGSSHELGGNPLDGRIIILHTRSASVIEIFDRKKVVLEEGVLSYKFKFTNSLGIEEPMIAALHYCATLDKSADVKMIKQEIMKPLAMWYCQYCEWVDKIIIDE